MNLLHPHSHPKAVDTRSAASGLPLACLWPASGLPLACLWVSTEPSPSDPNHALTLALSSLAHCWAPFLVSLAHCWAPFLVSVASPWLSPACTVIVERRNECLRASEPRWPPRLPSAAGWTSPMPQARARATGLGQVVPGQANEGGLGCRGGDTGQGVGLASPHTSMSLHAVTSLDSPPQPLRLPSQLLCLPPQSPPLPQPQGKP